MVEDDDGLANRSAVMTTWPAAAAALDRGAGTIVGRSATTTAGTVWPAPSASAQPGR